MSGERLEALLAEHADLERRLADPGIHADQATAGYPDSESGQPDEGPAGEPDWAPSRPPTQQG